MKVIIGFLYLESAKAKLENPGLKAGVKCWLFARALALMW